MRKSAHSKSTFLTVRLAVIISPALFLVAFFGQAAFMQEASIQSPPAVADSIFSIKGDGGPAKGKDGNVQVDSSPVSQDAIAVGTYPFTNSAAVALEDMSSGTTTLVAASSDDGNSALVNIGFEYWYDGVRFTQFGVNANGFARLGAASAGSSFDNVAGFASTTNQPKIAAFYDDLCVGTNGKVHFKTIGAAPNRKLIVEWQNMQITRGAGCAGAGGGTFQLWLFESAHATTPGLIEFVYGAGMVATAAADGGYSVGLQSNGAANIASVTTTGPAVSYAAANNTQTNAVAAGTAYLFTPNVPLAPGAAAAGPITGTSIQVNWVDNATNEVGYVLYRSTDNVNFTLLTQTAANATSFNDLGLAPGTQYFYRVHAVTEGALSSVLALTATTSAPGNDTCLGAGGNWDAPGTWTDGSVPTAGDNATIGTGCTVTVNVANAVALNVTIDSGGTLQSPTSGAVITNNLTVGGSVTNNGTLDFSTNGDTSAAILTFGSGGVNATFGGTGATTDVRAITVNKGAQATVVELSTTNFTVRGVNTDVAGYLTLTSGTFKISGTFTMTNRTFTTPTYVIPLLGGIWINNPNYTVAATASGTTTDNGGLFRLTSGTYNIGLTGADGMGGTAGAVFIVEGGTINAIRIDPQNAVSWTQSAGTVNLGGLAANTRSNFGSFELFAAGSSFTVSGGTINLIQATIAATPVDYRVDAATVNITGGQLNVGTAATATNFNFRIRGAMPALVIEGTAPAKTATFIAQSLIRGNVTIPAGTTFAINGFLVAPVAQLTAANVVNDGTITGNVAGSRFYFLNLGGAAQSYSGAGIAGTVAAPILSLDFDGGATNITLNAASPNIIVSRVILFSGNVINANKITLGVGGVSAGVVQIGNTTTPSAAGSFDVPFTFNLGTGGQTISYLRTSLSRSTGPEVNPTRILTNMTYDDNDTTHTLTIAGGDLTLSGGVAALAATNGRIVTGANTLILSSGAATVTRTTGYVDGNFRKTYTATGNKNFEVGTANAFSPLAANVTALTTNPSTLTVRAVQGPQPALNPASSLQRYWSITEGGDLTATLTATYAADGIDVLGTEANYRVIRVTSGTAVNFPEVCPAGPCVNEATNTITVPAVSNFSDWTAGEQAAPTAAPATISGQVTTQSGAPLAGVTMNLSGARSARTVTDSQGNYRFLNVDTNNFYTVTPAIVNYHFSPGSRSFSLLANKTDAVFAGTLDGVITGNVIDTPDYFVRQHYLDFLGREPDQAGLNFWSDQIASCGNDYNCIQRRTINVSAAYFLSIEFQKTGALVGGLYQASYGRAPLYAEFIPDTAKVAHDVIVGETGWENQLRTNTEEFLGVWVDRPAFRAAYDHLTNDGYVDALIGHTGVTFTDAERTALVSGLASGSLTRAQVLQRVAENEQFVAAGRNEMFVRMQYFGYLRRDPDDSGLHFWLNKLNEFGGNFEQAEMVKAFLVSGEYRDRFRQ